MKENFDVFVSCNNEKITEGMIEKEALFDTNLRIEISDQNMGGYDFGTSEAEARNYDYYSQYARVLFCQVDCFIVDSSFFESSFKED